MRCDLEGVHGEPFGANAIMPQPALHDTPDFFHFQKIPVKRNWYSMLQGLACLGTLYLRENSDEPALSNVAQ